MFESQRRWTELDELDLDEETTRLFLSENATRVFGLDSH